MTSTTHTNYDPALKQIYREPNVQKLTYTNRPLFGMLPKWEGFGGRNLPIVLQYGNPQGRSAAFATAQSNRTQVLLQDFLLTITHNYSVATISGHVIEATATDKMAFLKALKLKIDTAMAALADDIETALFRNGEGWIAQVTTVGTEAAMLLTLTQIEEITAFELGMTLVADATATGATLNATPASLTVDGINRGTGVITTSYDNSGTTTDWAASDYVFVQGDEATGATTSDFVKVAGLMFWVPTSAPTSGESAFGVDRSVDSRLYGQNHDGSNDTLEEAFIDGQSKASREGGNPDCAIMAHAQMRRFIKELGGKHDYSETQATGADGMVANVGYRSINIQGDHGVINCVAANKCQANRGWLLQKGTWQLSSLGPAIKMLSEDSLRILRQAAADGYEVRIGSRIQLSTKAPIWNVNVTLPSP